MNQRTLNRKQYYETKLNEASIEFTSKEIFDPSTNGYLVNMVSEYCSGVFSDSANESFKYFIIDTPLIDHLEENGFFEGMSEEERDEAQWGLPIFREVKERDFILYLNGTKELSIG